MIPEGNITIDKNLLFDKINEFQVLYYYFHVTKIPSVINSPLRIDKKPSLGFYINSKGNIGYKDYATGEVGSLIPLLMNYYKLDYNQMLVKLWKDSDNIIKFSSGIVINSNKNTKEYNDYVDKCRERTNIKVVIRDWRDYDLKYWESYGITLKWLKKVEVYPIEYKIIIKNGNPYYFKVDKYAYCYIERKEGVISYKIYQPYNTDGFKWFSNMDKSTLSLWTKVPVINNCICICSSLKDALCLWCNTGIPCISVPGEAFSISTTAVNSLKQRYNKIFIILDNDKPGIEDSVKLSKETGFINIIMPIFDKGKDISDYYHYYGKDKFIQFFSELFDKYDIHFNL